MEVNFTQEWEAKLHDWSKVTGRSADDLLQDAMAGYFEELDHTRAALDARYDEVQSGKVLPIDGESFFKALRKREKQLIAARK
jgi:hypothetical protein